MGEEDDIFVSQDDPMETDAREPVVAAPQTHGVPSDGEDPVVQEFPIYISRALDGKINLFQYPTRSANRSNTLTGSPGVVSARLKENAGTVEVDIPVDTTKFYDTEKGDKWRGVDKQSFGGVMKSSDGRYMIGVFKNGELHVSPVESVVQLRPQFKYFSKQVSEEKEATRIMNTDMKKPREAKSIQVAARATGELAPKFSGALSAHKAWEDEENVPIQWYDRDTDEVWSLADKFISNSKEQLVAKTTINDYLSSVQ